MNYALVGPGRMGLAVDAEAGRRGHTRVATARGPRFGDLGGATLAFEFSRGEAAEANVAALIDAGLHVVCGTTGWRPSAGLLARARAADRGVIVAPNYSVGVNVFLRVCAHAAALLGRAGLHDPFVVEMHHRGKRDAPSGTALRLARMVQEADPRVSSIVAGHPDGRLPDGALQVVGIRAGGEPGTHRLGYDGAYDRIVIEHASRDRAAFAVGAVLAAEWLDGRAGLHDFDETIDDLLGGEWTSPSAADGGTT